MVQPEIWRTLKAVGFLAMAIFSVIFWHENPHPKRGLPEEIWVFRFVCPALATLFLLSIKRNKLGSKYHEKIKGLTPFVKDSCYFCDGELVSKYCVACDIRREEHVVA